MKKHLLMQDQRFKKYAATIRELTVNSVVGEAYRGALRLETQRDSIAASLALLRKLATLDTSLVPDDIVTAAATHAEALSNVLESTAVFHNQRSSSTAQFGTLQNTIAVTYPALFTASIPLIVANHDLSVDEQERRQGLTTYAAEVMETKKAIDDLLATARESVKTTIAIDKSEHFALESNIHSATATQWLNTVLGVSAFALFLAGASMLFPPSIPDTLSAPALLVALAPRVVILSVVFYGLALAGRNYRASQHNAIVNRHRALALKTFAVLGETTSDQKVKDVLLAQAASTIFAAQPSGYSVDQAEPLPQATAVELLQRLGSK
ncbi:hypothetical protein JGU66_18705 [Myxococcaceae bacterium JPH2]|nr:hypothetical protein [Myxococcaceae bacterium JPH2]